MILVPILGWGLLTAQIHPISQHTVNTGRHIASRRTAKRYGFIGASIADAIGIAMKPVAAPVRITSRPFNADVIAVNLADLNVSATDKPVKKPTSIIPVKPEEQLCSLKVSDTEIQQVFRMLTEQTGLNILLGTKSAAKLTLHVEKMRLIDVMRHVCALSGFSFLYVSGAYVVATADTLKAGYPDEWLAANPPAIVKPKEEVKVIPPPPKVTQAFTANYVKTSQLVEMIKKLIPTDLEVIEGPSSESPTLTSVDPSAKTGQSSVTVTQEAAASTGTSHLIVFRGTKENVEAAMAIAKQVDLPRQQVSIAVTIHDISDDAVKNLGLSWNFSDFSLTESPTSNGIGVGHISRAPMTFAAAISALETKDVARLMASPNISVLDGEKAFILIGDRVNYPELVGYTSTNSPIFSVQTERVGIYLQVAANVGTDGYVTLTLYPQVSSITGYLNVNGASYPQVSSREAQTTLRVKSGETIVLGGLLQDTDIMSTGKVPILSQIPFFGELFKHRQKTKNKSQVIITIKPVISVQTPK